MDPSFSPNPCKNTLEASESADFIQTLEKAVTRLGLRRSSKYLVGVSGGADSMALLHGLFRSGFQKLVVCHLDHHLRGGVSAADSYFVGRESSSLGLPAKCGGVDVRALALDKKVSIEVAARKARHEFFAKCGREERCSRLLLAHHEDDQIETIIHHFFRGSGRRGLGGMAEKSILRVQGRRIEVLRPLLHTQRNKIRAWLETQKIDWREDASNLSPTHTRNRLRHQLVPKLDELLGRNFRKPLLNLAAILREEDEFLDSLPVFFPLRRSSLPSKKLAALPKTIQRRVVRQWLIAGFSKEVRFRDVEEVLRLLDPSGKPAKVNLPGNRHARRRGGSIFLE